MSAKTETVETVETTTTITVQATWSLVTSEDFELVCLVEPVRMYTCDLEMI